MSHFVGDGACQRPESYPHNKKAILFRTAKNMHNFNTCGMAGLRFYIKLTAKKLLTQFAHGILMLIIIVSDVEGGKDSLLHSRKWRAIELCHLTVDKSGRTLDLFFAFFGKNCVVKTADCNSNLVFFFFFSIDYIYKYYSRALTKYQPDFIIKVRMKYRG